MQESFDVMIIVSVSGVEGLAMHVCSLKMNKKLGYNSAISQNLSTSKCRMSGLSAFFAAPVGFVFSSHAS